MTLAIFGIHWAASSSTHPYNPKTSAKMRMSTMPTKMRDWRMYARTPC
jgi:hypothetical protein